MQTKIVIADDHPIVLAGIRDVIERDPRLQVVGQAQNPTALVELMQTLGPDIVISDYNMPGDDTLGDGIKLISYLDRNFPDTRILILTMVSNPSIIAEMYRAGASGVVRKSGDLKELNVALASLLAQRIYRSTDLPREDALPATGDASSASLLSPREFEVIRLFANGQSVGDIAKRLNRSSKTVSTQKVSAMRKLGAKTDQELITFCLASDLFN
ncbi:response regulator transcription factor [Stenotrophomonas sp. SRS1]|uniref:response regulator transcription factor n=1 Tax=Stenotrophomonas sp. SRS1 TaxID=2870345 RepID=UPI002237822A|nr:response regulator transcription factor [Stenotrophomonas sp. SRS1]MCW6028952.1 response regulator transcription factor [Stenotrophomonas sp. SRS1]